MTKYEHNGNVYVEHDNIHLKVNKKIEEVDLEEYKKIIEKIKGEL